MYQDNLRKPEEKEKILEKIIAQNSTTELAEINFLLRSQEELENRLKRTWKRELWERLNQIKAVVQNSAKALENPQSRSEKQALRTIQCFQQEREDAIPF